MDQLIAFFVSGFRRVHKLITSVLLLSFLLSSCNVIQLVHLLKAGKVEQQNYYQEIPVQLSEQMILLEISIDGKTYHFALDTGAPTMISEDMASILSAKEKCRVKSSDSQGNESTIGFSKIKQIKVGEIDYMNQGVAIYNFNQMRELSCFRFDGILGANTMKNSIWQIDLKNSVLRIANTIDSLAIPDDAFQLKFDPLITGTPVFSAEIDGIKIPGIALDYGSNYGIEIGSEQYCDSIVKKYKPFQRIIGYGSLGLYGGKNDTLYVIQLPKMTIEGQFFEDHLIRINKSGETTLGTDFLKNYLVTIDWDNEIVYMEHYANEPPLAEKVPFGFNVLWQDGKLIVARLIEDSPAHKAGLQLGDQIISVNDVDYSQVQPDQYCEIFMKGLIGKEVKEVELVFKTDTVTKEISMQLED